MADLVLIGPYFDLFVDPTSEDHLDLCCHLEDYFDPMASGCCHQAADPSSVAAQDQTEDLKVRNFGQILVDQVALAHVEIANHYYVEKSYLEDHRILVLEV
jgi:hypothetical protein